MSFLKSGSRCATMRDTMRVDNPKDPKTPLRRSLSTRLLQRVFSQRRYPNRISYQDAAPVQDITRQSSEHSSLRNIFKSDEKFVASIKSDGNFARADSVIMAEQSEQCHPSSIKRHSSLRTVQFSRPIIPNRTSSHVVRDYSKSKIMDVQNGAAVLDSDCSSHGPCSDNSLLDEPIIGTNLARTESLDLRDQPETAQRMVTVESGQWLRSMQDQSIPRPPPTGTSESTPEEASSLVIQTNSKDAYPSQYISPRSSRSTSLAVITESDGKQKQKNSNEEKAGTIHELGTKTLPETKTTFIHRPPINNDTDYSMFSLNSFLHGVEDLPSVKNMDSSTAYQPQTSRS